MAQVNPELTFSQLYLTPPLFKVMIHDAQKRKLFEIDPFNPESNLFSMTDFNMTVGMGQNGRFDFTLDDSKNRIIDREELDCGAFIIIDAGRTPSTMERMIQGYVPDVDSDRIGASGFIYKFSGTGLESRLANILMDVEFSAPIDPLTSKFILAERFKAKNVIRDLFQNPAYMIPSSKKFNAQSTTLEEETGISLDGISNDLDDPIFELAFNQTSASQILNSIEDQINIDIFVDANGVLQAKYPTDLHSGMAIKTVEEVGDSAMRVAYVKGAHSYSDSISSSDYASHLVSTGRVTASNEGSTSQSAWLSLLNKDIAQQIPTSALRFENLQIIIQRVGAGTNNANPLTYRFGGAILEDDNDAPSSKVVARFHIPIVQIPQNPTAFNVAQFLRSNVIADTSKKYWLALYEIGSGSANTIRWYHDNSIGEEVKQFPNAIRPLPGGRHSGNVSEQFSAAGWRVNWTGPTYSYIFQTKDSHEMLMKSPAAVKRWGRKDARVSTLQQGISDSGSMISTMHSMMENSAVKDRTYDFPIVNIPLMFFKPGYVVNFVDPPVGLTRNSNYTITIQEVTYKQNARDHPRGNPFCRVTAYKKLRPSERPLKTRVIPQ
jgi:hypothetical protein